MKRPDISRRRFLSTAGWGAAGLGASGLIAASAAEPGADGNRRSEAIHETEVLVCGGGPAGMAAATMAARQGRRPPAGLSSARIRATPCARL
jgi:alkyl hydroperoxide reductase subunit AhpF